MATSITATNKTPLIIIVTWMLLALAAFAYIIRTIVKIPRNAFRLEWDDYLLTGSLMFCVAQSVVTVIRADYGFGKPLEEVSRDRANISLKAELAANVLYTCSIALSKLSLLALMSRLMPNKRHRRVVFAIGVFVVAWSVLSIFVIAFQCRTPNTWDYTREVCIDRVTWWIIFDACNILTEGALIAIPLYIMQLVLWPMSKKITFCIPFIVRLCTIAACIADMAIWKNGVGPSSDPFFAEWQVSISTQVIQCSCLACTCVLYLKNFFASVETGFGLDEDLRSTYPVELRTVARSNLSSEVLTQSASMPAHTRGGLQYQPKSLKSSSNISTENSD